MFSAGNPGTIFYSSLLAISILQVRCRMSPEWVLAPDALQLATILCPQAVTIHLRFDCSTPNDVLIPLLNLDKIRQFSAVCVTSGERSNLDFSDLTPILEKYGPASLSLLELKVSSNDVCNGK